MRLSNLALLCSLAASACALHIPFKKRASSSATARFSKRGGSTPNASDPYYFENIGDFLYVGTITVEGQPFQVQLDTGSSDLWLDTTGVTFKNAENTNVVNTVAYLDGTSASGPILITDVTFGNWTAPKQAFISAEGTNATSGGDKGLLGVGPPVLSNIAQALNSTKYNGNSFLDNVFNAYPNDPNIITFLLSRGNNGTTDGGDFTIGTVVPTYENISKSAVLPVISGSEWVVAMDGVVSNGTSLKGGSSYLQGGNQVTALLDTGTSQALAPKEYVDLFYSKIPNAQWSESDNSYIFACKDAYVDVTMVFGDIVVFVHPIDMSTLSGTDDKGDVVCVGTFTVGAGSGVDFLLGDSFMRNAYSLFFFGEWTTSSTGSPYIKILPVTDRDTAFTEFTQLNNQRIANALSQSSNNSSNSSNNDNNTNTDSSSTENMSVSGAVSGDSSTPTVDLSTVNRNSYIIMGLVGIAILLLITNIVMGSRKNTGYKQIGARDSAPHPHFVETDKPYSTPYSDDR